MQAEHIPVHLGSMPDAVAAVLEFEQRPGDLWILNDPYRGGTHLPDITLISPVFAARERLGFAASRAHHADVGGPTPAGCRSTRPSRGRGRRDPADPRDRRRARRARRPDAQPEPAARRPARPARRQPVRRAPPGELANGTASRPCAPGCRRSSTTRSAGPVPGWRSFRTASNEAEDVLEDDAGGAPRDVRLRVPAGVDGERAQARLHGHRSAGRGQPQLPARGDEVGGFLRGTRAVRPRRAALGRGLRPHRGHRAPGLPAERATPAAVAAGNVETSSRVADLVIGALARRGRGAGPGPGDDEQPDPSRARAGRTTRRSGADRGRVPAPTGRAPSTSRCRTP